MSTRLAKSDSVDWSKFESDDNDDDSSLNYDSISDDSSIDVEKMVTKTGKSSSKSEENKMASPKAAFVPKTVSAPKAAPAPQSTTTKSAKMTPIKKRKKKKKSGGSDSSSSSGSSDSSDSEADGKRSGKKNASKTKTTSGSATNDKKKQTDEKTVPVLGKPPTGLKAPLAGSASKIRANAPPTVAGGAAAVGGGDSVASSPPDSRSSTASSKLRSPSSNLDKMSAKVMDSSNLPGQSAMEAHSSSGVDGRSLNVGTEYCRFIRTASYLNAVKVANGQEPKVLCASADSTIHVHSIATGRPFPSLEGHTDRVIALAVADPVTMDDVDPATGQIKGVITRTLVVSGARDQILRIWDLERAICIHSIHAHKSPIWAVAIAIRKNGDIIVMSTSGDGSMRSWNGKTGKKLCNFKGHSDKVLSVYILNPNSEQPLVFSAGADRKIRVWELLTGAHIKLFEGHEDEINSVVAQSYSSMSSLVPISMDDDDRDLEAQTHPHGMDSKGSVIIVSACRDLTIRVWDYKSGYLLFELLGHTSCVFEVALCRTIRGAGLMGGVAPKNQVAAGTPIIVSCSDDATIKFWNLENGKLIKSVKWHNVSVRGIDIVVLKPNANSTSANDLYVVVSCGWDKTIQFHPVDEALNLRDRAMCTIS